MVGETGMQDILPVHTVNTAAVSTAAVSTAVVKDGEMAV
jgi:hypothetical protein